MEEGGRVEGCRGAPAWSLQSPPPAPAPPWATEEPLEDGEGEVMEEEEEEGKQGEEKKETQDEL